MGSATRGPAQSLERFAQVGDHSQSAQPPSTPIREAAIRAAKVIADVHEAANAAAVARIQQVADFVSNTGVETHTATIAAGVIEEEDV